MTISFWEKKALQRGKRGPHVHGKFNTSCVQETGKQDTNLKLPDLLLILYIYN